MPDNVSPLHQIDPDVLRQGTVAFREAVDIRANAFVMVRPALFAPGQEALRLDAFVERVLPNNILRLDTEMGSFALRLTETAATETRSANAGMAAVLPSTGERLTLLLAPSGASARLEPAQASLPQLPAPPPFPDAGAPSVRPALSTAQGAVKSGFLPATSPLPGGAVHAPSSPPALGIKGLVHLAGSVLGAQRQSELWFQASPASDQGMASMMRGGHSLSEISQAFAEAGGLNRPSDLQRIAATFNDANQQPYRTMAETLALINPMAISRVVSNIPRANSNFGASMLFFLLCLRHGGVKRWLADVLDDRDRESAGEHFDYLDQQIVARSLKIAGQGAWNVVIVPFLVEHLGHLVWAVRDDPPGSPERFALQLLLPQLGPVQASGYAGDERLDLVLLSPLPFALELERRVQDAAGFAFEQYGLEGSLVFSSDTRLWFPFLEALTVDSHL